MIIKVIPSGPFHTNCYIVGCPETHQAAIIDPSPESLARVSRFISENGLQPEKILLTHSHWDHIADVAACKKAFGASVWVHELDLPNLAAPGSDNLPCWIDIEGVETDNFLKEGETVSSLINAGSMVSH